ncbi:lipopolysaccharide biosynthesis protein [Microbacterium sp. NPDC087665]|uniref:lipopolysaccharide biosynthesis protein n=1 Tax=Microbacterium sp. NPDC087665 TaxID=3364194 RepID=UPI0037F681CF
MAARDRLLPGRGHLLATGASVFSSALTAANAFAIAALAGSDSFGLFTVVITVAGILGVPLLANVHFVLYQELPRADADERPTIVGSALATGALFIAAGTAVFAACAPLLSILSGLSHEDSLLSVLVAACLSTMILTEAVLRGSRRLVTLLTIKTVIAAVTLAITLWMLLDGVRDPQPFLLVVSATALAFAVAAVIASPIRHPRWSTETARRILRLGALLTLSSALTTIVFGADSLMLNLWATPHEVGVYALYNGFPKRLLGVVVTEGAGLVLLPLLAVSNTRTLLRRMLKLTPLIAAATAAVSFAASATVFWFLRAEYPYDIALFVLAAIGIAIHTVFNLFFFILSMDGVRGSRAFAYIMLAGTPLVLATQAIAISGWQLEGALVAFILTNLLLVVLVILVARHRYRDPKATS